MIYDAVRGLLLRVLSAPTQPPDAPAGSPGTTEVFRASKRLLTVRLIGLAIFMAFFALPMLPVLAAGLFSDEPAAMVASVFLITGLVALGLMRWFLIRLDWDMRYYIVTDRSLRIRHGALIIRESTYTFANVQNVSVHQGPIDRLVGIANVRIDTAGGGAPAQGQHGGAGHHGVLVGIENAPEVRDRISTLLRAYRDAGLGDKDDRAHAAAHVTSHVDVLREIRDELRAARAAMSAG
ncbi:MAG: PH domain-containing protein [Polyangiaceae bacterium]